MTLETGSELGTYKVVAPLGAGGMGEVYRATDPRLERDVAIKVLPTGFSADAERLRRFEQEAKTLASLSHPHILVIHDTGIHEGRSYLVCELLEGTTLREQVAGGPLGVRKAVQLAVQAAQGLAAAHSKGVIHRDLKPDNLFITKEGHLKILDFGLAKLHDEGSGPHLQEGSLPTVAPTVSAQQSTEPGRVLGTPSYMSPEQVRGEPVDPRTDIFALGCVLFEMLTGARCFRGDSAVEVMTSILKEDPPELTAIAPDVSLTLAQVVERCLNKLPERRFQTALDLGFALETIDPSAKVSALTTPTISSPWQPLAKQWLPWAVAVVALITASLALVLPERAGTNSRQAILSPPRTLELHLPDAEKRGSIDEQITDMTIAPDGRKFVYINSDGLWLRWLDRVSPSILLASASGARFGKPIWAPQGDEIAYLQGAKLYRLAITGGQPKLVCETKQGPWPMSSGGSWFPDDRIVFTRGASDLFEVSALGGEPRVLLARAENETGLHYANPLPESRGVLLVGHDETGSNKIQVLTPDGDRKLLLELAGVKLGHPTYSRTGHVIYQRNTGDTSGIWAFPFSLSTLERTGEPMLVTDRGIDPSTADDGSLLLNLTTEPLSQLTWVNRDGQLGETLGPPRRGMTNPRLSSDAGRIAIAARHRSNWDIWTADTQRGAFLPAVRSHETEIAPHWYPDNRHIAFRRWTRGKPRIFRKTLDGTGAEEELFDGFLDHLSQSGKYFIIVPTGDVDPRVRYVSLESSDQTPIPLPKAIQDLNPSNLRISPDDQLLAFNSSVTGRAEVYVVDFPQCATSRVVSRGAGRGLEWRPDGRELFYWADDKRSIWSVKIDDDAPLSTEEPTIACHLPEAISSRGFQPTMDGQQFLLLQDILEPPGPDGLPKPKALLIEDWYADLQDGAETGSP